MSAYNIRSIDYTCDLLADEAARFVFGSVLGDHSERLVPAMTYASMIGRYANYCVTEDESVGEKLVAVGSLHVLGEGVASLENIAVVPEKRKVGVGRFLLDWLENVAESSGATVMRVSSLPEAVQFYRKCGYVGIHPIYTHLLAKPLQARP